MTGYGYSSRPPLGTSIGADPGSRIDAPSDKQERPDSDAGTIRAGELIAVDERFKISLDDQLILMGAATAPLVGVGIFIGLDGEDYEFRAGDPDGHYIHWDGATLIISGTLDAVDGFFSGTLVAADGEFTGTLTGVDGSFSGTLDAVDGTFDTITAGILRDAATKFKIDLTNKLLTVVDEQGSPVTRVRLGDLGVGTTNYGIEIYSSAGALILGATGLGVNVVGASQVVNGSLAADKLSIGQLDELSNNVGILVSGQLIGSNITLDLDAAGTDPVLEGTNLMIRANGAMQLGDHFSVDTAGNVTFTGDLTGASGTFDGTVGATLFTGATALFQGSIEVRDDDFFSAGTVITQGNIFINGPLAGGVNITVDFDGFFNFLEFDEYLVVPSMILGGLTFDGEDVSFGANDSGGAGKRALVVDNA